MKTHQRELSRRRRDSRAVRVLRAGSRRRTSTLSDNRNPHLAWQRRSRGHEVVRDRLPRSRRAQQGRRREPGRPQGPGLAAARGLLPLGAGGPARDASAMVAAGEFSSSVTRARQARARGAPRRAPGHQRLHRLVRFRRRRWRATTTATTVPARRGTTSSPHRYVFTVYALDVARLPVDGRLRRRATCARRCRATSSRRPRSPAATRSIRR